MSNKHYITWIDVANEFWNLGMTDKDALRRHQITLQTIADHAETAPSSVDFNDTLAKIDYTSKRFKDRTVSIMFSRLHGRVEISDGHEQGRCTLSHVIRAFGWLNEKKPRKPRKGAK